MNDWFSVSYPILMIRAMFRNSNISAYRKGQSTTTVPQAVRDDSKSHETFGGNYDDLSRLLQSLRYDLFQKSYHRDE